MLTFEILNTFIVPQSPFPVGARQLKSIQFSEYKILLEKYGIHEAIAILYCLDFMALEGRRYPAHIFLFDFQHSSLIVKYHTLFKIRKTGDNSQ